ncbi:hypothetical protein [Pseudoxanthomonas mexicana]|uniref:hypothetical protein n=1 Tax=Pseudoxanthomonas mexicana TaxID=128785 RepID=UPI00289D8B31|nr:hypothetical protein [Pseudoxanthomonas mexicana]
MARLDERLFNAPLAVANQIRRSVWYFYDFFRSAKEGAHFALLIAPVDGYTPFSVYKLPHHPYTSVAHEEAFGVVELGRGGRGGTEEYRAMVRQNSVGMFPGASGDRASHSR